MNKSASAPIFKTLIHWYLTNKRELPWRQTALPYHIYLSEIIFQQTRIDQGLQYYKKIIRQYPDINSLANASETDFLNLWQGLGYYSRAHNALKAARIMAQKYAGHVPESYEQLIELPGIGPYTAAAIASIAFGQPCPVVDGNVKRVISRLLALQTPVDKPELTSTIHAFLQESIHSCNPSDFNQALMEFGALVCTPANPQCTGCPLHKYCKAYISGKTHLFPVKAAKKEKPVVALQYYIVFADKQKSSFYLVQRNMENLWKGFYEFPGRSDSDLIQLSGDTSFPKKFPFTKAEKVLQTTHILTHRKLNVQFFEIIFTGSVPDDWILQPAEQKLKLPVHKIIQEYLSHN